MILLNQFNISNISELDLVSSVLTNHITKQLQKNNVSSGIVIFLNGTLGVGKTAFMKNFLKYLGYQGVVKSPSYAILNSYETEDFFKNKNDYNEEHIDIKKYIKFIHHFDAYRIQSIQQWFDYQFEDCFAAEHLIFIEWPENCQNALAAPDFCIDFKFENEKALLNPSDNLNNPQNIQKRLINLYANYLN